MNVFLCGVGVVISKGLFLHFSKHCLAFYFLMLCLNGSCYESLTTQSCRLQLSLNFLRDVALRIVGYMEDTGYVSRFQLE